MTAMFDPYQQWLGIPLEEQPPHYYRLLGVALFESNRDRIEAAAARQAALLRNFLSGATAELAKKLLSEVTAARACLLNPATRAVYDQQLKRYLENRPPEPKQYAAGPVPPPVITPELAAAQTVVLERSDAPAEPSPEMLRKQREAQRLALVGIMCAGLLLIAAVVVWQSTRNDHREPSVPAIRTERQMVDRPKNGKSVKETDPQEERPAPQPPEKQNEIQDVAGHDEAAPQAPKPQVPNPQVPQPESPQRPVAPKPPEDTARQEAKTPVKEPPAPPVEDPAAAGRLPVPSVEEQKEAAKVADKAFPVSRDASMAAKLKAAKGLLALADESREKPAERFYLLRRGSELACEGGDVKLLMQTLGQIGGEYEMDVLKVKEKFLLKFGENLSDPARLAAMADAAKRFVADAADADRFDLAISVAKVVNQACLRPGGKAFRKQWADTLQRMQHLQSHYAGVREAVDALAARPDDPAANLVVGRWHALGRGNWGEALPYLAKGGDGVLAQTARRELESPPTTAEDEANLGDAWWDLAQATASDDREEIFRHCATWYRKARGSLPLGLDQAKVDKRLAEIAKTVGERSDAGSRDAVSLREWIDILAKIDVKRDTVAGDWKRSGDNLTIASGDFSRLMLPVRIQDASYDLEVEFTRTEGTDTVAVVLPVGKQQVAFVLSAGDGFASGLEMVSGMPVSDPKNMAARRPGTLPNNRLTKLMIEVRQENEKVKIGVSLNGKPYVQGAGFIKELSLPGAWAISDPKRPAIGTNKSSLLIRRAKLRLVSGDALLVTGNAGDAIPADDAQF